MSKGNYSRNSNTLSMSEAIQHFISTLGIRENIRETEIIANWEEIVGKMIAKHTLDLSLKNKKLSIRFDNAALKQEISYSKNKLVKNINDRFKAQVVTEIIIL